MIMREYAEKGLIPEVISVSIGYPYKTMRDRDYTYGFMNFSQFLKNELIPYIDKNYSSDPINRTLFGHSYGGLCGLFTLLQYFDYKDITFRNIISSSPSIWWQSNNLGVFGNEISLHDKTNILPVNLYMTMGSLEGSGMIPNYQELSKILINRNYQYLNFAYKLNEGYDHSTNSDISFREGIVWVLNQEIITPSEIEQELSGISGTVNNDILVYPNPAKENLVFRLKDSYSSIELINSYGKTVLRRNLTNSNYVLDIKDITKGLYVIVIQSKSGIKRHKIVLQ
jgi:hypothetical protein